MNNEVLLSIQREVYLKVRNEPGQEKEQQQECLKNLKKTNTKVDYNDFVGFLIKKKNIKGDLGFVLKRLLGWGHENVENNDIATSEYIESIEYSKEKEVVHVTLKREIVTSNLIRGYSNEGNTSGIVNKSQNKKLFSCDLYGGNFESLANIRILLNVIFSTRLSSIYDDDLPTIVYHTSSEDDTSELVEVSQRTISRFLETLTFDNNTEKFKEETLKNKRVQFCQSRLKEKFSNYIIDKDEKLFFDVKGFFEENASSKEVYAKDLDTILLLDADGNSTKTLKIASSFTQNTQPHQPVPVVYFAPKPRCYQVQKSALLSELLIGCRTEKFCLFDENKDSLIEPFINTREKELFSSYQSRFGNIVKDRKWIEPIQQVTISSLILDIMSLSQNNRLKLDSNEDVSVLSSRKSLFILYNYARICKLKQQFDENVEANIYAPISEVEKNNFSCFTEDSEWKLVLQYLLLYPVVLRQIYSNFNKRNQGNLCVNQLCQFLNNLCHDFSSYYHQTKILLDNQTHLAPLMNARLHLVISIRKVMDHSFYLLGITPPKEM